MALHTPHKNSSVLLDTHGTMLKADGLVQNWLGHACFSMGTLSLSIRRMPAFFETFPVILIDQTSTVRADIAFRRSTSTYSMEESQIQVYFSGGCLNGTEYSTPSLVKAYARKAQFGQIALAFSFSLAICGMLVVLSSKTFGQV